MLQHTRRKYVMVKLQKNFVQYRCRGEKKEKGGESGSYTEWQREEGRQVKKEGDRYTVYNYKGQEG